MKARKQRRIWTYASSLALGMMTASPGFANEAFDIIGGTEVDPAEWPAHVIVKSGDSSCSGTIVGPAVILTAAHCVSNPSLVGMSSVELAGKVYELGCRSHPRYPDDDLDIAFCFSTKPFAGVMAEHISFEIPPPGESAFIAGFGCTIAGGRGSTGVLHVGAATTLEQGSIMKDIVLRGAAACFGDSGGAVMIADDSYFSDLPVYRAVAAIASKSNIRDTTYAMPLGNPQIKEFLSQSANTWRTRICGLNTVDETICRSRSPQRPGLPEACLKLEVTGQTPLLEIYTSCLLTLDPPPIEECEQARLQIEECYNDRHR